MKRTDPELQWAPRAPWYRFIAWLARHLLFGITGGVALVGDQNVPKTGAVLIAPVHVSHLDPPLLGSCCPRELRFMAKEELFKNRLFGGFIRSVGAYPVKRGESDTAAIKLTLQWLKEGRAVLVFPEGQRGDAQTIGPMLPGIAVLAKRSGAPVVPVGIHGTNLIMPKGGKKRRRCRVTLLFAEPFFYADCVQAGNEKLERQRFLEELSRRIVEACHEAGLDIKNADSEPGRTTLLPTQTPT